MGFVVVISTLAERGMGPAEIAKLLSLDEASVMATLGTGGTKAGRVLGSNLQEKLDDLLAEDPDLCCPISLMLFTDPVVASDGFMYEKASLELLLRNNSVSPMTRVGLEKQFFP